MSDFLELAKVFGLPLAMALVAVWAFATDRVISRGRYDAAIAAKDGEIEKLERRERELFELALTGTRSLEHATTALRNTDRKAR